MSKGIKLKYVQYVEKDCEEWSKGNQPPFLNKYHLNTNGNFEEVVLFNIVKMCNKYASSNVWPQKPRQKGF